MAGLPNAELFVEWKTGTVMCLADTVSSDFQGAGASASKGLVPDPGNSGTTYRYLNETGIWKQIDASEIANLSIAFYSGQVPSFNAKLNVRVSSSAAIINVYNLSGSVPTTASPAFLIFRASTENDGGFVVASVVSSLSLTIPSGATLGVPGGGADNAFRIWVVGQLSGSSSFQLAVVNCVASLAIYPLKSFQNIPVTAQALTTGSDSAIVIYAPTSVQGVITILGNFTYESGLTTAGEWSATPTTVVMQKVGAPGPGDIVNQWGAQTGVANGASTSIPLDNTTPTSAEGTQFLSATGFFISRANLVEIQAQGFLAVPASTSVSPIMSLFRDAETNAFAVALGQKAGGLGSGITTMSVQSAQALAVQFWMVPGVPRNQSCTIRMRAGPNVSTTSTAFGIIFNGYATLTASVAAAALFNGALNSYIHVREFMT